ncbi:four helix bundle protein [Chryseobacterium sp. SN22]|uniref:four helix bundle protein n=1 Tax=Chryseobacterium sp. SN22 TaxID=2606431 RepID=UPI001E3109E7|nr:four helix bundle protein [Chryseobacterium sp. SN22]
MRNDKENIIVNKTFNFALSIIEVTEDLHEAKRFPLANQIFKAGRSIGANVREAQNAESKADFVHKLKIAAKEADRRNTGSYYV